MKKSEPSVDTQLVHDALVRQYNDYDDIAPAIHPTTIFYYPRDPDQLIPLVDKPNFDPSEEPLLYNRLYTENVGTLEKLLSSTLGGKV